LFIGDRQLDLKAEEINEETFCVCKKYRFRIGKVKTYVNVMEELTQVKDCISYIKLSNILQNKQKAADDNMLISRVPQFHLW
jgi:hypothetical protein